MSSRGEVMGELTLALREVRGRLAGVLQSVGEHVDLGAVEMDFLDLISRKAPTTPGELATTTGLSPATVTGILDRLEEGGWIRRCLLNRDFQDRPVLRCPRTAEWITCDAHESPDAQDDLPKQAPCQVALGHVQDEGPGLLNSDNLFVPFFTTKHGGSGIGLILSRQIAEAHGGTLQLSNRKDHTGAEATLSLPLASG